MKKCQICGKPATVHLTQVVNNEMKNIDLCDECAEKSGLLETQGSPLALLAALGEAIFGEIKQNISDLSGMICSECGCTPVMFKETGRLGCANCYKDLKLIVDKLIESSQKGNRHVGKKLQNNGPLTTTNVEITELSEKPKVGRPKKPDTLKELQMQLEQAIAEERYEDAAALRDKIKNLNK